LFILNELRFELLKTEDAKVFVFEVSWASLVTSLVLFRINEVHKVSIGVSKVFKLLLGVDLSFQPLELSSLQ
jgi:hypothetical protein